MIKSQAVLAASAGFLSAAHAAGYHLQNRESDIECIELLCKVEAQRSMFHDELSVERGDGGIMSHADTLGFQITKTLNKDFSARHKVEDMNGKVRT